MGEENDAKAYLFTVSEAKQIRILVSRYLVGMAFSGDYDETVDVSESVLRKLKGVLKTDQKHLALRGE